MFLVSDNNTAIIVGAVVGGVALVAASSVLLGFAIKRWNRTFVHPQPSKPGPWTKVIRGINKPKITSVVSPSNGTMLNQTGQGGALFDVVLPGENSTFRPPISTRLE